jgi:hypothetical protein
MAYLFLIAILLTPIAIIVSLIYSYKKLSLLKFLLLLSLVIALVIGTPLIAFKIYERNFMLSVVPDVLNVTSISYSEEEGGFGPGGNEAGIRTYQMPEQISKEIESRGIEFFRNLPPNKHLKDRDWRGRYDDWRETPIKAEGHWKQSEKNKNLNIYDYVCAYSVCIDIKPEILAQASLIFNSKGSYYAYGRIGLIVVSPKNNLVLYLYTG